MRWVQPHVELLLFGEVTGRELETLFPSIAELAIGTMPEKLHRVSFRVGSIFFLFWRARRLRNFAKAPRRFSVALLGRKNQVDRKPGPW